MPVRPSLSPGLRHCVVFLGKKLHSHSASLHLGVSMDASKFIILGAG